MAGGKGVLGLRPSGEISTDLNLNFLMRARELFAREGMAVAALDVASDQPSGLNGDIRLSAKMPRTSSKSLRTSGSAATYRSGWSARAPHRSPPCRSRHGFPTPNRVDRTGSS
jgi:hypothetical protein